VFDDWLEVRKAKRAGPVTQTVLDAVRREAGKAGISLQDAIAHCCLSGWQGFRADWYLSKQATRQPVASSDWSRRSRIDNYAAQAAAAARGEHGQDNANIIDIDAERIA
jgi:hypothetical protein